ncbi:MAG: ATP phosphoribosyltransferase regulatory subunit [Clostridia bacterium]|nr:ATP phosphoribosyltransferase regulatory subunit [Clostridia bacterium]
MKKNDIKTPIGTRDRLFDECRARRRVEDSLRSLFLRRGFSEVSSPSFEYFDACLAPENPIPQEMLYKMSECTGKLLVLRPDMTTPIARIAATKLPEQMLPARLCYVEKVYRACREDKGMSTEILQGGIELLGYRGIEADIMMIVMAVDALRACTDKKIAIELGFSGYFKMLAGRLSMSDAEFERMRTYIENKNFAALSDMLDGFGDSDATRALKNLSRMFGGIEILDNTDGELAYLKELYRGLEEAGVADVISIDLGLVHQIDYYSGIIIRGYMEGVGTPVLSGGRYDNLITSFGKEVPAVGFAIDIDAVAECVGVEEMKYDTLLHITQGAVRCGFEYLDKHDNTTLSSCKTIEESRAYAEKNNLRLLVIYADGTILEVK